MTTLDLTDRNTAIAEIRKALKERTGKTWSVTGDRGTAWGWITIQSPPKRRTGHHVLKNWDGETFEDSYEYRDTSEPDGYMTPEDIDTLKAALDLDHVHFQGVTIPASGDYRLEYVARARGEKPTVYGVQYWD